MARVARSAGIDVIAATPHLRRDFPRVNVHEIAERCATLCEALNGHGLEIRIVPAAEISLPWALRASEDELRLASYRQAGQDLLIETPTVLPHGFARVIYDFVVHGYRVTLAHPERCETIRSNLAIIAELVELGIQLEVNAEVWVKRRTPASRVGRALCVQGQATAVASDGHSGVGPRTIGLLAQAKQEMDRSIGSSNADRLLRDSPLAIIDGSRTHVAEASKPKLPRRFLGRG